MEVEEKREKYDAKLETFAKFQKERLTEIKERAEMNKATRDKALKKRKQFDA